MQRDIPDKSDVKVDFKTDVKPDVNSDNDEEEVIAAAFKKLKVSEGDTAPSAFIYLKKEVTVENEGVKPLERKDVTVKGIEKMKKPELIAELKRRRIKKYTGLGVEEMKKILKKEVGSQMKLGIMMRKEMKKKMKSEEQELPEH